MTNFRTTVKTLVENWRTTASGIAGLGMVGFAIYKDPTAISNPAIIGTGLTSLGLLLATDAAPSSSNVPQPVAPSVPRA